MKNILEMSYLLSNNTPFPQHAPATQSYTMPSYAMDAAAYPTEPLAHMNAAGLSNANNAANKWTRYLHRHGGKGFTAKQLKRGYSPRKRSPRRKSKSPRRRRSHSNGPVDPSAMDDSYYAFDADVGAMPEFNQNAKGPKTSGGRALARAFGVKLASPKKRKSPKRKAASPKRKSKSPKRRSASALKRLRAAAGLPATPRFGPYYTVKQLKGAQRRSRNLSILKKASPSFQKQYASLEKKPRRQVHRKKSKKTFASSPLQEMYRDFVSQMAKKKNPLTGQRYTLSEIGPMWVHRRKGMMRPY